MKAIFYESDQEDIDGLKALMAARPELASIEATFTPDKLTAENAKGAAGAEVVSVFIHSDMGAQTLDQLTGTKLLVTRSAGFDHVDVAHAKERGIAVCNVPAYDARAVAEFALSLILGLTRNTFAGVEQVRDTHSFSIKGFEGFDLKGRTLGILGTGKIGMNVAQLVKGFEMNVIANDAFPNAEQAAALGFKYVTLDELLAQSDVITVHVPYMPTTHHLINMQNVDKIKHGAVLVNTSRGEILETEAILHALDDGTLAAVGLDVIEGERAFISDPSSPQAVLDAKLIDHAKVFVTPHVAFFSKEAKDAILKTTADEIAAYAAGAPINTLK